MLFFSKYSTHEKMTIGIKERKELGSFKGIRQTSRLWKQLGVQLASDKIEQNHEPYGLDRCGSIYLLLG